MKEKLAVVFNKDNIKSGLFYWLELWLVAAVVSLLFGPVSILLRFIIPDLHKTGQLENGLFACIAYVVEFAAIFGIFYFMRRRERRCTLREFMKPFTIAMPIHFLTGLMLHFAGYMTGNGAFYLSVSLAQATFGADVSYFDEAPLYLSIPPYLLTVALIFLAVYLSFKLGTRHNDKARKELTGKDE